MLVLNCFDSFRSISNILDLLKWMLVFWSVLCYKWLCLMRLSDSVSFSVYTKIFWRYFDIFIEKCPRSVNNVRTNFLFLRFRGISGVLNGPPPHPHPRCQCQSSLPEETNMEQMFPHSYKWFLWTMTIKEERWY